MKKFNKIGFWCWFFFAIILTCGLGLIPILYQIQEANNKP